MSFRLPQQLVPHWLPSIHLFTLSRVYEALHNNQLEIIKQKLYKHYVTTGLYIQKE